MTANTAHPAFPQPLDPSIAVWRYMDFAKYVALVKARALHFARLDNLGDPFEGSLSKADYQHWVQVGKEGEARGDLPPEWRGRYFDVLMGAARRARKQNYVSCWHMNRGESEAMWRLYSSSGFAIAIRSTYQLLVDSLPSSYETDEHLGPFVGVIQYANHHEDQLPTGNGFHPLMHKRLSFEHEHECRAVVWRAGPEARIGPLPDHVLNMYPTAISVPITLGLLIERVVVSPSAPEWFSEIVADVTARYDLSFPVERSTLAGSAYL